MNLGIAMDGLAAPGDRRELEAALAALRPKLHRYCARMTGTVFDGEDAVQDALAHALRAFDAGARPDNLEAWLMRITHNAAIDFLRRRARQSSLMSDEMIEDPADAAPTAEERHLAASSLRAFLALPVAQRGSVILMDVLGYSLGEIAGMLRLSQPAVKAALHRGRERLRTAAAALEVHPAPVLSAAQRSLYERYVDRFNARDFEAIRDMLAEEVWLDMVARTRMKGAAEVSGTYLRNYGLAEDWRLALGVVDGRPALIVHDPADPAATSAYFVQLEWDGERVAGIRDFRYARYVIDGAKAHLLA
ncbi:MAG TPA: sigma-70 family RNA polymerase sigma factor [Caulobacteraceae bacterium]